jgi:hypothetical protein
MCTTCSVESRTRDAALAGPDRPGWPLVRGSDRCERVVLRPDGLLWARWLALGSVLCPCFYSTAVRMFTVVPPSVEV